VGKDREQISQTTAQVVRVNRLRDDAWDAIAGHDGIFVVKIVLGSECVNFRQHLGFESLVVHQITSRD
jgi:hypothetical protein